MPNIDDTSLSPTATVANATESPAIVPVFAQIGIRPFFLLIFTSMMEILKRQIHASVIRFLFSPSLSIRYYSIQEFSCVFVWVSIRIAQPVRVCIGCCQVLTLHVACYFKFYLLFSSWGGSIIFNLTFGRQRSIRRILFAEVAWLIYVQRHKLHICSPPSEQTSEDWCSTRTLVSFKVDVRNSNPGYILNPFTTVLGQFVRVDCTSSLWLFASGFDSLCPSHAGSSKSLLHSAVAQSVGVCGSIATPLHFLRCQIFDPFLN